MCSSDLREMGSIKSGGAAAARIGKYKKAWALPQQEMGSIKSGALPHREMGSMKSGADRKSVV